MKKLNVKKAFGYSVLTMGLIFSYIVSLATNNWYVGFWIALVFIGGVFVGYENGKRWEIREKKAKEKVGMIDR